MEILERKNFRRRLEIAEKRQIFFKVSSHHNRVMMIRKYMTSTELDQALPVIKPDVEVLKNPNPDTIQTTWIGFRINR